MDETLISDDFREVQFDRYCKYCKYVKLKETCDPCNECLDNPVNENTDKPFNFKGQVKYMGSADMEDKKWKV